MGSRKEKYMDIEVKHYEDKYFSELCNVMDKGRLQELKNENLQATFIPLVKAPYQNYLLSCKIYIATIKRQKHYMKSLALKL